MDVAVRQRVAVVMSRANGRTAELITFRGLQDDLEHFACIIGGPTDVPLVRVHSECITGDMFGSTRCDCGPQLDEAMEHFAARGGILIYLRQEGRGIGLYNKIDAYALQDRRIDTFSANEMLGRGADERDYEVAAEMLTALGVSRIELLTNNPDKVAQLQEAGVEVVDRSGTDVHVTPDNWRYLAAKREHGHELEAPAVETARRMGV